MQITFNPHYEFNRTHQTFYEKVKFPQNYSTNSFSLPNYHQVDKSLVNFCGKKYETPLNDYFGGYQKEKTAIDNILITPLNNKSLLPPSLLLAFPDSHIQMQTMQGIINTSNADFVAVLASDENLCDTVRNIVNKAREKYKEASKQTVIVIDEAEKAIGMTPAYAKELSLVSLSSDDFNYFKSCGADLKKVNFFKSLLDNINNPTNSSDSSSPAMILFTTKKPQYIHPDLITRDGKMKTIIFPTPCGKNVKDSIKFETEKIGNKLKEIIEGNVQYTNKSQTKQINSLRTAGKLQNLSIDVKNLPLQKIMNYATPSKKNGAFSNQAYQKISEKSLKDYIAQPKTPYSIHFVFNLASTQRDISSNEYQNYESMKCLFGE